MLAMYSPLPTRNLRFVFDIISFRTLNSWLNTASGISGAVLSWQAAFLDSYSQVAYTGASSSTVPHCYLGVPLESLLERILFYIFVSPIDLLVSNYCVNHQQHADEVLLYISFANQLFCFDIGSLHGCLLSSSAVFFFHNDPSPNTSKSDAVHFLTQKWRHLLPPLSRIDASYCHVAVTNILLLLYDNDLTFCELK